MPHTNLPCLPLGLVVEPPMPELAGWQGTALLDDEQRLERATPLAMKLIYQPAKFAHGMSSFDIPVLGSASTSVRCVHGQPVTRQGEK
jgi:hypothetical protein